MAGLPRPGAGASAAATDKRFRRAHVKPSRKRTPASRYAWLAMKALAIALVVGYGGYLGVTAIAASQTLQVSHLVVRGHQRMSTGEVLALVDGLRGENILAIRIGDWQQKLLASPWVERATIRRVLPATLEIMIHERVPIGIGRLGTSLYLIDVNGVIVDEYGPAYADIDLPIIDGLAAAPAAGGGLIDTARTEFAGRVLAALSPRPELFKRVSQLDVSDLHDAVVILDDDTALLRLGDADFVARLQQYVDLQPALRERLAGIDSVDLRFDERLYVRPVKALPALARR
jgi:cell division protein FtsQ